MMNSESVRGDLFGGATAAVVALPLALAFGVASGAGVLAGLYGAILAGFFAAIFGGTKVQVTGPTGPMTVVMALVVTHFHANLSAAFLVVVLAGVAQIVFGKLGIGRFIKLVPQPVVSGFMSGIGFIIIIGQIGPLLGHADPHGTVLLKLAAIPEMLWDPNIGAILLGSSVLVVMALIPRKITTLIPSPLVALVLGSLMAQALTIAVPVIGPIPSGLPTLNIPQLALTDIPFIIRFALILAFLGSIDSLLTSIVVDSLTSSTHDSNKELMGQGLGNIAAGLFGGLPSAGATMRTLINVRAGGNSRLSGITHSVLLLAVALGCGSAVSEIPLAVLAGILVKVGIDIIDWNYLRRLRSVPRAEVFIMTTTLLTTVFVDLITAVALGFVMASVLFVSRMAEAQINSAKFAYGADQISDLSEEEDSILRNSDGRIVLFHVEGPLSFGSARDVARLMQSDIEKDVLAIDLRDVPFIDSSATDALDEVIQRLSEKGDTVLFFGARDAVASVLRKTGVITRLGEANLFDRRIEALRFASSLVNIPKSE